MFISEIKTITSKYDLQDMMMASAKNVFLNPTDSSLSKARVR